MTLHPWETNKGFEKDISTETLPAWTEVYRDRTKCRKAIRLPNVYKKETVERIKSCLPLQIQRAGLQLFPWAKR